MNDKSRSNLQNYVSRRRGALIQISRIRTAVIPSDGSEFPATSHV
jgi:hypothetical protein